MPLYGAGSKSGKSFPKKIKKFHKKFSKSAKVLGKPSDIIDVTAEKLKILKSTIRYFNPGAHRNEFGG